jgi:UDP-N-acetylglucosamine acyltransferase
MTIFRGKSRELVPAGGGIEIGDNVTLGSGVRIIFALKEGESTKIGNDCYIWHNAVIGHDCQIGDNTVVGVGCNKSGMVHIGKWSYVAVGSTIAPRAIIGDYSMIGHGSNVRADAVVPNREIWVGNPAAFLKMNKWRPAPCEF